MSAGEFSEQPLVPEEIIPNALNELHESQAQLFEATTNCVKSPTRKLNSLLFNEKSQEAYDAFKTAVAVIASCDALPVSERADSIAEVYIETEEKRIDFFQQLSPMGEFQDTPMTHEDLSGMFCDYFENGMEATDIAAEVANIHMRSYGVDLKELLDSAEPSRRTRAILFAMDAGSYTLEASKIAAGVMVGTILARQVLKKLGD